MNICYLFGNFSVIYSLFRSLDELGLYFVDMGELLTLMLKLVACLFEALRN